MSTNRHLPRTLAPFIWHFLKSYKSIVSLFVCLALSAGLWGPFNSILIKIVIDLLSKTNNFSEPSSVIIAASLIVVNFIVFDNFTWRGITYIRSRYIPIVLNQIIATMLNYIHQKPHKFFQDNLSGKISKQITNLVDGIENIITSIAGNFLRGSSLLIASIVASYFVHPVFCLILVIWFIFFGFASYFMSRKIVSLADKQAYEESKVVGELVDSVSNQQNVRLFATRKYEVRRMHLFLKNHKVAYKNTYFYNIIMNAVQGALISIMIALSCFSLIHLYSKHLITIGDFALILGLAMETGHMMWFTMSQVDEFNKALGRCKRSLFELITPIEIQDLPNAKSMQCTKGQIIFNNVEFFYDKSTPLFQNKNVEIKSGEKIGLVGYSGGGKSTFISLMLRFYDVTKGTITIDGQDISRITQDSLRAHIALIPQDPVLFHRSLIENIRYGKITASDEDVIKAAKKAHAHEFIIKLPHGYNSLVGERGVKLSGGQRQRIAIARAFLKNSPILILDEATSQIDSVTENLIQESLNKLMKNKTTIVIAHRLSTLLHMDRILVFDKGRIVEDNTHKELLKNGKLYKKLWAAQIGGFLRDKYIE
ncbi:MAG: ABC transporter ATP-binding protein [Rickettsiales bacterium]